MVLVHHRSCGEKDVTDSDLVCQDCALVSLGRGSASAARTRYDFGQRIEKLCACSPWLREGKAIAYLARHGDDSTADGSAGLLKPQHAP
jgi:hypothetical protein